MSNILLISAPGAGKGVTSKYLKEKYNMVHMSIGNLLHLGDAFLFRRKNTTVTGNYAIVTVDNNGIDEAELTQRGAQLIDLLR